MNKKLMILTVVTVMAAFISLGGGQALACDVTVTAPASIQAAIDGNPGGVVCLDDSGGPFNQSVVFGPEDSGVTLKAEDGDSPVLDGSGSLVDAIRLLADVSDVTIEGLEIRNYSGPGNGQGNAIQAWNDGTSDIIIENNVMHDNSWNAVLVGNEGQGLHEGWVIENNVVYGNGAYSLELTNAKDSVIEGNTVTGGWAGILIQARDTVPGDIVDNGLITSSGIVVENNEVSGVLYGIYVISYAGTPVDPFEPIPGTYSFLEDIKVSGNEVHDNDYFGIYLWGFDGYAIQDAVVTENNVNDNGLYHGIVFNNVAHSEVSENEVSGSGMDGIALYGGASNNEVEENEVSDSVRYGISLRGGASDNTVAENEVSGSGTADLHDAGTGNTWEENECTSSSPAGLCGDDD